MKTSIVLSTHPAKFKAVAFKGDFEANVRQIAALGYDGVELAIRDPLLIDAQAVLRTIADCRLSVPAIGTGQAWGEEGLSFTDPSPEIREAAIRRICDHIPLAALARAVIIIGLIRGTVKPGIDRTQAEGWLVEALQRCAKAARLEGVRLALEPINRYETELVHDIAECLELLSAVDAPNLGILPDTFHMNIEEATMTTPLLQAGSRIFHVHVADSNRCHPGAGHINLKPIIEALREIGYEGYVSVEAMPNPDAATCAVESIKTLKRLLA